MIVIVASEAIDYFFPVLKYGYRHLLGYVRS